MDLSELKIYLNQGREIEFHKDQYNYFLTYDYDYDYDYPICLFDCTNQQLLCSGKLDDILNYKFSFGKTLKDNCDEFIFDYIL